MIKNISLKDALFLGFCAVLIIVTKAALRLHLHIPGHAMFFLIFFLLLVRGCVPYKLSATFTGFMAGLMAMALGMGKGGPLIIIKFIMPAMVVDIGALMLPVLFNSFFLCGLVAALAASTKFINTFFIDTLVGMEKEIVLQHAILTSLSGVLFGITGSLFIPPVIKKLNAHGIIESRSEK